LLKIKNKFHTKLQNVAKIITCRRQSVPKQDSLGALLNTRLR